MMIENANDAKEWLRYWNGKPRRGVLSAVIQGLVLRAGIMSGRNYSDAMRSDNKAAIATLKEAEVQR